MSALKKICVFCGSQPGAKLEYTQAARLLAEALFAANLTLVYGGANVGLMGEIANRMLELGGEVIGVIPTIITDKEIAHTGLSKLYKVDTMSSRKELLIKLSDAFIMLPGGEGSLDEFFEVMTLAKLDFHHKPFGILNTENYYDHLLRFLDHGVAEQFIKSNNRNKIITADTPHKLLQALRAHQTPPIITQDKVTA